MSKEHLSKEIADHIIQSIATIQYGAVEVLIHDSQVVQVERKEKRRFQSVPKN